ncbi:hypothetical protein I6F07_13745 [Ensifer sp. IC4062]|nr:hypothetical protein [Ensifer sp. IC4062]MCA1441256.1 hypothetical protein [Ensifer sp. IC4062]
MSNIRLTLIAKTKNSRKTSSPSLFRGEDGRLFIQGFMVNREIGEAAETPSGETVVEIDQSLIDEIKKNA